jgi:hypothetical protein
MNCKPGDLAITVDMSGSRVGLSNSGRIVEVLRFVGRYRYAGGNVGMNTWAVKLLGGSMRASNGREYRGEVFIDDKNLRPIRPGDIPEEEVRELYSPSSPVREGQAA